MNIKIIRDTWANGNPLTTGKEYELDDSDGRLLIQLGHAVEAKSEPKQEPKKSAPKEVK